MARIIIADDDPLTIDIVRSALESRGHIVGALDDGAQVQKVVELKQPDLVILDCMMPQVSGLAALRQIRTAAKSYDTPVLVLTGRRSMADEGIAWETGADDYLRKPFDPDELVARVECLLASNRRAA